MKAVIMAGGEGIRLRPVSANIPKPMVTLVDRPVLGHILGLLKENGITEVCLTLRYLPEVIRAYVGSGGGFGMKIETRVEAKPLGTAGSVRACADFIGGEDFLVISGDCICDFDLRGMISRHRALDADATIGLHTCPEPLEYGLVVTEKDGRIAQFTEKPSWDRVLTDQVNTGIYVLSPRVLDTIPEGTAFDFGKNVFPNLLKTGGRMYGHPLDGYWCDIGNPGAYLECSLDLAGGRVNIPLPAEAIRPGVRARSEVPADAVVHPPVYIDRDVTIGAGAVIGPDAVLCAGTVLSENVTVKGSVLLGASVGAGSRVEGAVLCTGAILGPDTVVQEGAVIGARARVGEKCVVSAGTKIWPEKHVPAGTLARGVVRMDDGLAAPLFSARGVITGEVGAHVTPELCLSLGQAAAQYERVGVGWCGGEAARMLAEVMGGGVTAAGGRLLRYESSLLTCAAYVGRSFALPLTVFFQQLGDRMRITFFGPDGGVLSHEAERKLSAHEGDSPAVSARRIGTTTDISGVYEAYIAAAARVSRDIPGALKIAVTGYGAGNRALSDALAAAGCTVVPRGRGIPCLETAESGTALAAVDEEGRALDTDQMLILAALTELERGVRMLAVPYSAPAAIESLAAEYGAQTLRLERDGEPAAKAYAQCTALRDGIFAGVQIAALMKREGVTLYSLARRLPSFRVVTKELPIRRDRGMVMRALSAFAAETGAELDPGVRIVTAAGVTHVAPVRDRAALQVRAEGATEAGAEALYAQLAEEIRKIESGA